MKHNHILNTLVWLWLISSQIIQSKRSDQYLWANWFCPVPLRQQEHEPNNKYFSRKYKNYNGFYVWKIKQIPFICSKYPVFSVKFIEAEKEINSLHYLSNLFWQQCSFGFCVFNCLKESSFIVIGILWTEEAFLQCQYVK